MNISDLNYYRNSECMTVLPWKNTYSKEALVLFDDIISNMATVHQVVSLDGEQARVKVWAAYDARESGYSLGTGKCLPEREKEMAKDKFMS